MVNLFKDRKLGAYIATLTIWSVGFAFVSFFPGALAAYQSFLTASTALATALFVAHVMQRRGEQGGSKE